MPNNPKIIFVFIDGLGIGPDDPEINPLCDLRYPNLRKLLSHAVQLDACLGVEGLPQSATGQATLLTGINAAKRMNRHIEGFPPPALKKLIERENLFSKLRKINKHCTFANSYWMDEPHRIPPRRQSVTTVMTLSALGKVRSKAELLAGQAVNHDITRWSMHTRGYTGPLISPAAAAEHLISVANEYHFTLFEYFLTDRAGHSGQAEAVQRCLEDLDQFVSKITAFTETPNHLFLLSSDHGNIEDQTTLTHTKNPVPLVAVGERSSMFHALTDLTEVSPTILNWFQKTA